MSIKVVVDQLILVKSQLDPLRSALSDDGLEVYSDDLQDVIDRIEMIIGIAKREAA